MKIAIIIGKLIDAGCSQEELEHVTAALQFTSGLDAEFMRTHCLLSRELTQHTSRDMIGVHSPEMATIVRRGIAKELGSALDGYGAITWTVSKYEHAITHQGELTVVVPLKHAMSKFPEIR